MAQQVQTAKRKAAAVNIPPQGEDPAERKRTLNVLAQRRYRQRRREHVKRLEEQNTFDLSTDQQLRLPDDGPATDDGLTTGAIAERGSPAKETSASTNIEHGPEYSQITSYGAFEMLDSSFVAFPDDLQMDWDLCKLPSLSSSPSSSPSGDELTSFSPANTSATSSSTTYSFPDEQNLPMLELNLLRGAMSIAKRLNIDQLVWSIDATSPFTAPDMVMTSFNHLPQNLRPTLVQLTNPHHPMMDLLPWPSVRDRLILMFAQPLDFRAPIAASPTALVDLVYDIEDSAEGVRIWADDPYSAQNWEVGEKLFKNWWWALDADVLRRSNEMRLSRGANLLGASGSIIGEVT